ncbi:flagellar hook-associated protein FlgK [Phenylobacterium sp. J367]|uniref:flagellar hook-associated protein FlgK n=1 Tax=Phenylobacterium sp. J367 TaxID=2898435 RepID=UPI0021513A2F|nr:flagellar hook-associated protein FlgK [Phenylobacterium sp. J367]MCR5877087.1 flagellar hook-associated protein FlgK [Phenylobacterium sp. J367]
MSINMTLRTAGSGLMAAQTGLRAVSDNISNVNTPGYVRKEVEQRPIVVNGVGMGVEVTAIKRVTDQYLQLASYTANSESSRWGVFSEYLDTAQALFGDPSDENFFFNRLDKAYAAFAAAADDPSSSLLRSQSIGNIEDFLSEANRINTQIDELGNTIETRIGGNVERVNELLGQINRLNGDISRAWLIEQDSSGSENIQSGLVDELSGLMSVQVTKRPGGGVDIRSAEGVKLAGDGAATLSYVRTDTTRGYIKVTPAGGIGSTQAIQVPGGEIRGLMDLRDTKLPELSNQLGEFVARASERLNAAHNASSSIPAPSSLNGRLTGLDLATAVSGFTGKSTVAIVDATGVVQHKVEIDFDTSTFTVNGAPGGAFSSATFLADLNIALTPAGSATFTDGALSIAAVGAGRGVAVDEGTSMKAGRQFSHFFGLNDIVRSTGYTTYETGLKSTDPHGFIPGDQIKFTLAQADGKPLQEVAVTVPAGATMADLLTALNDPLTGVGGYGSFTLDANGAMSFKALAPINANLSVNTDATRRGVGGPSISQLFGLGVAERTARADRFEVNARLVADPTKLAFGKLDLTVAAGQPALRPGDGRGALALSASGDVSQLFQAAGSLGDVTMTVSRYASEFGGSIGRDAASAQTRKESAKAVLDEASARRQAVEGVNLDEELVRLTTYQQAFNASARMIQAAKDLFDVLVQMV